MGCGSSCLYSSQHLEVEAGGVISLRLNWAMQQVAGARVKMNKRTH